MRTSNTKLLQILKFLSKRPKPIEEYTPKFCIGDIIINKYQKDGQIMDLICRIRGMNRNEDDLECKTAQYSLETLYNNGVKKNLYIRSNFVRSIDAYYNIIKPETAQILYGIELDYIKKPKVKGE